jgi:hypothetical protein
LEEENILRPAIKAKVNRWWPFVLLLAAAASRWMVADTRPEAAPSLVSAALGCGWAAMLAFTLLDRGRNAGVTKAHESRHMLAGAMLLGGPAVGMIVGARELNAGALTIALALTPVVVAVGVAAFGAAKADGVAGRIWPGLAAVTGLLLVLIQPNLSNTRSDIALALAPVLTGMGAALFWFDGESARPSAAYALMGAAALFAFSTVGVAVATGHMPSISWLAVAYEGLLALLSVLALRSLGAMRWSSQFTWLPLLILLQGIVMVRPPVTARWLIGLGLITVASVYLLLPQEEDRTAPAGLLH